VLMRLTTHTEVVTVDVAQGEERNEDEDSRRVEDWERKRKAALWNLRTYLLGLRSLLPGAKIAALEGTKDYCPGCRLTLPRNTLVLLHRGELVTCTCRQRALYWIPTLNL
jgi:hypothetical protein